MRRLLMAFAVAAALIPAAAMAQDDEDLLNQLDDMQSQMDDIQRQQQDIQDQNDQIIQQQQDIQDCQQFGLCY